MRDDIERIPRSFGRCFVRGLPSRDLILGSTVNKIDCQQKIRNLCLYILVLCHFMPIPPNAPFLSSMLFFCFLWSMIRCALIYHATTLSCAVESSLSILFQFFPTFEERLCFCVCIFLSISPRNALDRLIILINV